MENQGEQKPETWVTENYQDPNWQGTYQDNLIPGARFLYFALHELGLVAESITRDKLETVVNEVHEKHNLVAGNWEMLEACVELSRYFDYLDHMAELRKAAQDGFDNDLPF